MSDLSYLLLALSLVQSMGHLWMSIRHRETVAVLIETEDTLKWVRKQLASERECLQAYQKKDGERLESLMWEDLGVRFEPTKSVIVLREGVELDLEIYSRTKELWKTSFTLHRYSFPIIAIGPCEVRLYNGWISVVEMPESEKEVSS